MRLGIDASNIRRGGGVTHLSQLLNAADPSAAGFERVIVWGSRATLKVLPDRPWLDKRYVAATERGLLRLALWRRRELGASARVEKCDLLFVPGGAFVTRFRPVVTMSRNMLPFEFREMKRYAGSLIGVRLLLLRFLQSRSFRKADGVIFLTEYAWRKVCEVTGRLPGSVRTIPHGLDAAFFQLHKAQRAPAQASASEPLDILYVSIIDLYKHQWHVAEAVAMLRKEGLPVRLAMVGPANPVALRRLRKTLQRLDPAREFLVYEGALAHRDLPARYAAADLVAFASSCENMPNILLEAMASSLPIACSDRGPMPEILGEGGVYFDPESPESIAGALRKLVHSPELRAAKARVAVERARQYSWTRCAVETFTFLAAVANGSIPCAAS